MKNKYTSLCCVCQDPIPPGEGILYRDGGQWLVLHAHRCPRGVLQENHVKSIILRSLTLLDDVSTDKVTIQRVVTRLGHIVRCGWLDAEVCTRRILSSTSIRTMDRLDAEEILHSHLPHPVSQ